MTKTTSKPPGKAWKTLSFIPALNWISVLYIGILTSNGITIIASIAYAIITFINPKMTIITWILCIVHYTIMVSYQKKQIAQTRNRSYNDHRYPPARVNSQKNHPQRTFSTIEIPGDTEHRQSIPQEPPNNLQISYSFNSSRDKFFQDIKRYAAYEGKTASFVPFMSYWPTYENMDNRQKAWYFYWRSQVRRGNYPGTDLSYIFLHIYELLSGVGWSTPQQGLQMLINLWLAYKGAFLKLSKYLSDWVFDFALQYNLDIAPFLENNSERLRPSVQADILIERHINDVPLKLSFPLIDALCDYSLVNSKFYKEGNHALMTEAIPRVVALADAMMRKNTQKGILSTYGPHRPKQQIYYTFASAVCPQANQRIIIAQKAYSTNQRLRSYINELVRYGENTLRSIRECKGRLRGIVINDTLAKTITEFLKAEYGNKALEKNEANHAKKIALDFQSIEEIRKQSDAVREALKVDEESTVEIPEEKELLTDLQEITSIYQGISPQSRELLDRLAAVGWECILSPTDESYITEINRLAKHFLGCALLVKEQDLLAAEDDYRDELDYIYKNPPSLPAMEPVHSLINVDALPTELGTFISQLFPEQKKALHVLLTSTQPENDLLQVADDAMTMPQILIDDINDAAMQALGDFMIGFTDQVPCVTDEYAAQLTRALV